MLIKFYNVKKRESVEIEESECYKVIYKKIAKNGKERECYVVKGIDEGTKLTSFISKDIFDKLKCDLKE